MPAEQLRKRYVALFGLEPVERSALAQIESRLCVLLPEDLKEVSVLPE
jgi:hypothetical protein